MKRRLYKEFVVGQQEMDQEKVILQPRQAAWSHCQYHDDHCRYHADHLDYRFTAIRQFGDCNRGERGVSDTCYF